MIHLEVFTGRKAQALPVGAHAVFALLFAGWLAEVRRWAADIVDVPFKIRLTGKQLRLPQERCVATRGNHPALVERKRAE